MAGDSRTAIMMGGARFKHLVNVYAYLGLIVLAGFWMMDGVTAYRPAAAATRAPEPTGPRPAGRVFILFLDSLRYETAMNPDIMPHLAALRAGSVWARVKPAYNAITVPCVRAAFTGREDVSVLAFVQNFLHGDAAIESFFSQFADAGGHTAVFSDGSFLQFGAAINPSVTTDLLIHGAGVENYDDQAVTRGLALFHQGGQEIVIVHVRYTDYAAHRFRVGTPKYIRDFRRADRLVAQVDAAVQAPDTLIVMGDHGHAVDGSHSLGQDIPTFALWRGPMFKRGLDLGFINIMSHRWFLGEILGVPPPEDYLGGRYSGALAGTPFESGGAAGLARPEARPVPVLLWVYFAALAVLGAGLLWPDRAPWMQAPGAAALVWLALPAAIAPLPWNAWIGVPVALGILAWLLRGQPGRAWALAVAAVAVATGCHYWGSFLAAVRDGMNLLTRPELALGWLGFGGVVVAVATRRNRRWIVAAVGLAAGFLALPTNYPYGFTGMMVPLLWLWLAAYTASLVRDGQLRTWPAALWAAASLLLIFSFTQSFAGLVTTHYIFRHFVPVVPFGLIDNEWVVWRALVAKILIFFPAWPRRWLPALVKCALILFLFELQWRSWDPGAGASALIASGLLASWLALRRRDPELAGGIGLALLFFLFVYFVRPIREVYAWADCLLAGLMLATRWLKRFPQPENARADYTVLGVVAFLAAGFFTTSWSIEKLEWSRIYTWFPANLVEAFAVVLVPLLVAKTALPLVIGRTIMARELGGDPAWPGENLRRIAGLKLLTLLVVLTGIGASSTVNNVYLEGAQQLTILLILAVCLAFEQGRQAPEQPAE